MMATVLLSGLFGTLGAVPFDVFTLGGVRRIFAFWRDRYRVARLRLVHILVTTNFV